MDDRHFQKTLFDSARRLIPRDVVVVCAVSGGPDSMAMLHGLHDVNHLRRFGWRLHVAHLNHMLHADAERAARFVEAAAAVLGLPCSCNSQDVRSRSRAMGQSIEEAARNVRYEFLEEVATRIGALVVAVGHHADDQAETVLHRVLRGTGLRGLAGIPERRALQEGGPIELVRPMLGLRRADSRDYLQRRGAAFVDDPTNADVLVATRNRIRHEILPAVSASINPDAAGALLRLSAQARGAIEVIRRAAEEAFEAARDSEDSDGVALSVAAIEGLPTAVQSEIILLALERLSIGLKSIGAERIEAAAELLRGDGARRTIQLTGGAIVQRRGRSLIISTSEQASGPASESLRAAGPVCEQKA